MIRLIAAILFTCCFAAQLTAQPPQGQATADKDKKEQTSVEKAPAATAATIPYVIDTLTNWSAVMVGSFLPEDDRESHIYRSGKLMRTEGLEGHGYYVTDLSTQETHHVWPAGCSRDKHVFFRAIPWATGNRPGYKVQRLPSGKETLDGHSCQVETVSVTAPELARPLRMKFWEAEDLQGFPIQIEFIRRNGRNKIVRYKNVVVGPQDPTIFIHPTECEAPVDEASDDDDEGGTPKKPSTVKIPMSKPAEPPKK